MSTLAKSSAFRFRWINGQCFEFRFPNGKSLLTDPWYSGGGRMASKCPPGFTVNDLEGADYLFINHGHGDHTANIQEVVDRFHSTLITHSANCMAVAKGYNIPLTSIYPVDFEGTYYFDGFILETHHGVHHRMRFNYEEARGMVKAFDDPGSEELNILGGMFNMNFILTTEQGFRIAFLGGDDDGMLERMRGVNKPNVVIRNKLASSRVKEGQAEKFADWFAGADVPLLIPMHYETWLTDEPEFAGEMFSYMNKAMEEKGKIGRVAPMVRGKWYTLDISVVEAE